MAGEAGGVSACCILFFFLLDNIGTDVDFISAYAERHQ